MGNQLFTAQGYGQTEKVLCPIMDIIDIFNFSKGGSKGASKGAIEV